MLLNCAMAANTNVQIKLYLRNIMQSCVVLVALTLIVHTGTTGKQ
jgi:hypothetical protein